MMLHTITQTLELSRHGDVMSSDIQEALYVEAVSRLALPYTVHGLESEFSENEHLANY